VELLRSTGADIRRHIGLGTDEPAQAHELMKAERVGLHRVQSRGHAVFPIVVGARPLARANAVAPVVAVSEAASGPAKVRRANPPHVVHELLANATDVGNLRIAADPDAVVDDAARCSMKWP
jgi:hypothetical protein